MKKIVKPALKTLITRSAHSCVLLGKGEYIYSGFQPEEDLAAGADVDPTVPETGPEEEMTGDEEGSEEEIPEIQPPLPMPAAIPDLPVPGVDLEGEIPEDKEAQTDDLL